MIWTNLLKKKLAIDQTEKKTIPSDPNIAREQGLLAIANSRDKPLSKGGTLPPPEMSSAKKFKHSEPGLTGQVLLGLAPDRNFISAPGHFTLRFERVIRNVCLKSFSSKFVGNSDSFPYDAGTTASVNPFLNYCNINASIIPLDDNSIALAEGDVHIPGHGRSIHYDPNSDFGRQIDIGVTPLDKDYWRIGNSFTIW